jgi:hypothetical protein
MLDDEERQRKGALLGARIGLAIAEEKTNDVRIAEACNVSAQAVGQWRTSGKVDKFYLPILAHALRRDIAWFFVDEHDPIAPREVHDTQGKYSVLEIALQELRAMVSSGQLAERDVAALVNFASNFKSNQ